MSNIFDMLRDDSPVSEAVVHKELVDIDVNNIRRFPFNREVTEELCKGLTAQLEQDNWRLINPITVVAVKNNSTDYMLVCGERRWTSFKIGGRKTIQARIVDGLDDKAMRYLNLVENQQQEPEDLIVQAKRYKAYCDDLGVKQKVAAEEFGIPESEFSQLIKHISRIESVPEVHELYLSGTVDKQLLQELIRINDKSPAAMKSIIDFGKSNKCLTRRFVRGAAKLNLYGDVEADLRAWQLGNFEGDPREAKLEEPEIDNASPSKVQSSPKEEKKYPAEEQTNIDLGENNGQNASFENELNSEAEQEIEHAQFSETDKEPAPQSEIKSELTTEPNLDAPEDNEGQQELAEDSNDLVVRSGIQMRKRPVSKAEIMIEYQEGNYFLDTANVATEDDKVILRAMSGEYVCVSASDCKVKYVA